MTHAKDPDATHLRVSYSIPEVAEMVGISRRTVYEEIYSGRLSTLKIGARRLVSRRQLDAWLADREAGK